MVFTKLILRSAGKSWSQTHDSSYTSTKPVILQMKKLFTPILISRKMKIFPVSAQGYKITLWKCFHLRVPTFAGCVSVTIFHQKKDRICSHPSCSYPKGFVFLIYLMRTWKKQRQRSWFLSPHQTLLWQQSTEHLKNPIDSSSSSVSHPNVGSKLNFHTEVAEVLPLS